MNSDSESDSEYFEIEKIVDINESDEYIYEIKIKWKNYSSIHNSWEPISNINVDENKHHFFDLIQISNKRKTLLKFFRDFNFENFYIPKGKKCDVFQNYKRCSLNLIEPKKKNKKNIINSNSIQNNFYINDNSYNDFDSLKLFNCFQNKKKITSIF